MQKYELEVWWFHYDDKMECIEEIEANSLEEAVRKVSIKHHWKIYYKNERVKCR